MDDNLLHYYERELTYIRELGAEFARKYPKIAGRLLLEKDKCEDPHTERLLEAFAFLSARIHKKIDDNLPEITESLLGIIYPHYLSPIPSMSIVRFEPVKQGMPPAGYHIPKGTVLYSKPVGGTACRFSTSYPVTLWPIEVVSAGLADPAKQVAGAVKALTIELKSTGGSSLSALQELRFFLNGQHQHIFHLYELIFNNVCRVEINIKAESGKTETVTLDPDTILPVGFRDEEIMLPYPKRSFPGYILLFEYFCFPEKFLFFDIQGLNRLGKQVTGDAMEIVLYLDRAPKPDLVVTRDTFCLGAAPVINLFERVAEPIRVSKEKTEYRVIPDIRRQTANEIYQIEKVVSAAGADGREGSEYRPFYSIRHHLEDSDARKKRVFWHMERRPSEKKGDGGTEVYLSFADLDFRTADPGAEIVTAYLTCTNRDLPSRLPFGDPAGDFDIEAAGQIARISSLIKPTPTRRPSLGGALQWQLISHLSLNYLSIVEGGEEGLKEILKLYDFENTPSTRQQIAGIVKVSSEHITRRMGRSFCRGVHVTIQFDEDKYVGSGLFLFASVLERFLAQYVSVNSFTQLEAKVIQRPEVLKKWPPRSGNRILI
ncbi:MAG TPA: type VI secretion system baseplate subunit TssF [Deltaproteobacteria bacterium]|nr:type VI secretion system baseplate subunit TssF [Deltaproteobacteria bacterium]